MSALSDLIDLFAKLPGLGPRSARRLSLFLLKNKDKNLLSLIDSLNISYKKIIECENCGNIDMQSPCNICSDSKRDKSVICIVEDVSDLWTLEKVEGADNILKELTIVN